MVLAQDVRCLAPALKREFPNDCPYKSSIGFEKAGMA